MWRGVNTKGHAFMKTLIVCALAVAVSACSASNHTASQANAPASAAQPASASTPVSGSTPSPSARAPAQNPQNAGWRLLQGTSSMDGREFVATKAYTPDNGVQMVVTFKCLADTQRLHVTISSIVGDPNSPSRRSAFQEREEPASLLGPAVIIPNGRIRFGSLQPEPLTSIFKGDEHFLNEIFFDLGSGGLTSSDITRGEIYFAYLQLAENSSAVGENIPDGFNATAALHALFPIVVELVNGVGTYDLSIPYADQIRSVLDQCGGAEPVLRSTAGTPRATNSQSASPTRSTSSSGV